MSDLKSSASANTASESTAPANTASANTASANTAPANTAPANTEPSNGPASGSLSAQQLGTLRRHRERGSSERDELDRLLDAEWTGVLSTVVEGEPWAVPMLYARDGDTVWLHGSTGAGALRRVAEGAPAVLTVMAIDALVVGPTTFSSSANYRSATVRGRLTRAPREAQDAALERFSEAMLPGRTPEVRPPSAKELAQTLVVGLPIETGQWLYKTRTGHPSDPAEDERQAWAGLVPVQRSFGTPEPAPWVDPAGLPASVRGLLA